MKEEVPNLDCMSCDELREFWAQCSLRASAARRYFGAANKHTKGAIDTLRAYAIAKSCAQALRLAGDIRGATVYETHCDLYYADLPPEAKW